MKRSIQLLCFLFWISCFGIAQVEFPAPITDDGMPDIAVEDTDISVSEPGPISACDVREITLKAEVRGEGAQSVQFDYSRDGRNWHGVGTDADGSDGFSAKMGVSTLPDGTYFIQATTTYSRNRTSQAEVQIEIFNSQAAPHWVSPENLESEISGKSTWLEVTQDPDTSNWEYVTYAYSMDGINFTDIATDTNGENGWGQTWDLSKTGPGAFILRAMVKDTNGNLTFTLCRVARIYESDFFGAVSEGPITFQSFSGSTPLKIAPEDVMVQGEIVTVFPDPEPVMLVESMKGTFNYTINWSALENPAVGHARAKLFLDPLDDGTMFSAEVQVAPGGHPSFNTDGLAAGPYRATVLVSYNSVSGAHTFRSAVQNINATKDTGANFGDADWATSVLDGLIAQTGGNGSASMDLKRDGITVAATSNTVTTGGVSASVLGSGFARLAEGTYLSFLVTNTGVSTLNDALTFTAYSWSFFGDPLATDVQTFPISLAAGESVNIALVTPGIYGQYDSFAGFKAEMGRDTAGVTGFGFAGINEDTDVLENISLEIGDDQVAFEPFETNDYQFKSGFPEYHWVKCQKVRMFIDGEYDPAASYSTTIVNRPGRTTTIPKKCPTLHAGIIGGPHSVRITCISKDGTTKVFGSEHYVHKSIRRITIKPKPATGGKRDKTPTNEIVPTDEYKCGKTIIGLSGPGGTLTHTTGTQVTVETSITSTISGTIGKEGVASIGSSIGVTSGVSVTVTNTNEYSKPIPDGQCASLKQRLCYKVWKGVIEIEFDDGTVIKGDWEARKLDSVGYKMVMGTCQ